MQNITNGKCLSREAANKRLQEQLRALEILSEIYSEEARLNGI